MGPLQPHTWPNLALVPDGPTGVPFAGRAGGPVPSVSGRARLTRTGMRSLLLPHEIPDPGISPPSAYSSAGSGKMRGHGGSSPPSDTLEKPTFSRHYLGFHESPPWVVGQPES
jgi:hypothetical protein